MKHQQVKDISNLYNSIYEDKEEAPKEMVSLTEEEIQEGGAFRTGNINLPSSRRGFSLDKLRSTVVDAGGAVGAHRGRGKHGNVLGIPERVGRKKGREAAGNAFDQVTSGNIGGAVKTVRDALRETKDSFDIVKGHLIDEGYADTEKAAVAIMANMSEEWKQSILDEAADRPEPLWGKGSKTPDGKPSPTIRKPRTAPDRPEPLWGKGSKTPDGKPSPTIRKPRTAPDRDEPLW